MSTAAVAEEKLHARLGPSGAERWMNCPGSLKMEEPFPDTSSVYADEGTAAHQLMEWCLTTGQDASAYAGRIIQVGEDVTAIIDGQLVYLSRARKFEVDEDMVAGVQQYCDIVRSLGGEMLVEQTVDLSRYLDQPDCFGTSDTMVILDDELVVIDLKYGRGHVPVENNKQLMLYGLGALDALSLSHEFKTVRLMIVQPKIDYVGEWVISVEDLEQFALEAKIAARHAVHQLAGGAPPKLKPSEKACVWCKAKTVCPAYIGETTGVATQAANVDDFEDLTVDGVVAGLANTDAPTLAQMMAKIEMLEALPKAVRAEVERRLVQDPNAVPGYKLVEGKRGNRSWVNADEAELQLKSMRLKTEQVYDLKLISPTTAEKLAKAGTIGPRQWKKLQALYGQSQGKPSVAPESDKRPAITVAATADDFAIIEDGSDLA